MPGLTLHPSGALIYQPFLTGPPGSAGVKGGVDILDAHSEQFMTDVDALHGSFLTTMKTVKDFSPSPLRTAPRKTPL